MKLFLPLLVAALVAVSYGATTERVKPAQQTEVTEEAEEYRWKQEVGKALEKVGRWLQGKYSAATEEEEEEMQLMAAELEQVAAAVNDNLGELDSEADENEDEVVPYGLRKKWRKWRKKLAKIGKKIGTSIAINKVVGAVAGASG